MQSRLKSLEKPKERFFFYLGLVRILSYLCNSNMKISVTKLQTYLDCPRKYWYKYQLMIDTPKSEGFYFGSAIHEGLDDYYNGKDPMIGVKGALYGNKKSLSQEAVEGTDLAKMESDAKRIFDAYKDSAPHFEPLLVEHFFTVDLVHPETLEKLPAQFVGKIDLITTDCKVIDHKTSSSKPNGFFEYQNTLQANGYTYAYLRMFGMVPNMFIFNHIVKGNTKRDPMFVPKPRKVTLGDACMFFDECKAALDSVLRNETRDYPNRDNCRMCPYKNICTYAK